MQINRLHLACGFTVLATAVPALTETRTFDLGNSVRLEVRRIPKGRFLMGSPDSEAGRNADEKPHTVVLSQDFYLGRTAVTFAQWERFALETGYRSEAETGTSGGFGWNGTALEQRRDFNWRNTGYPQTPGHPVVMVTWEDSRQFLKWLSLKTGWTFELPAEAQWEYACRAGTTTAWWIGNEASAAGAGIYSKESSGNQAHPVTSRPANPWELHISGNVQEWCADWFGPYDFLSVTDPVQRTAPASDKPRRVLRGGSWLRPLKDTRSAARYRNDARSRNADNGFRVMSFGPDAAAADTGSAAPPSNLAPTPPDVEPPDRAPSPASSDPATPPRFPDSAPPPVSSHPPAQEGKRGGSWLLLILLGGMAVWIARRILRASASRPPLPDRRTLSGMRPPPPPPLREPLDLVPGAFLTRRVDDGFWLNAGYAAGTWLNLTWRDEHGLLRERRVQYAPGDDGHFIYTGSIPEQIQASAGEPDAIPPLPLPVTPPEPGNFSQNDGNASSWHQRPGHRPPAY